VPEDPAAAAEEMAERLERFELTPVAPAEVERRLDAGDRLVTVDVPSRLGRKLVLDSETGVALYRLVQLFGTPNVPGLEAGADQPDREQVTWRYLFELTYDDPDGGQRRHLLSLYDYRTDVSVGLSSFVPGDGSGRAVPEPVETPLDGVTVPDDERFLQDLLQLSLNVVEEPVPATFKELWV